MCSGHLGCGRPVMNYLKTRAETTLSNQCATLIIVIVPVLRILAHPRDRLRVKHLGVGQRARMLRVTRTDMPRSLLLPLRSRSIKIDTSNEAMYQ